MVSSTRLKLVAISSCSSGEKGLRLPLMLTGAYLSTLPLKSTLAGRGLRLSIVPIEPPSCWIAVAKSGRRVRSAKLAEPLLTLIPPMRMPSGLPVGCALEPDLPALAEAPPPGCSMISSLTLVVRSSLMMKRA
ncbi:hypothetical protein D3C78_1174280 [compost metagenome]